MVGMQEATLDDTVNDQSMRFQSLPIWMNARIVEDLASRRFRCAALRFHFL